MREFAGSKLLTLTEGSTGGEGVPKNAKITKDMNFEFENLLHVDTLRFRDKLILCENQTEASIKEKLNRQLHNARYIMKPRANEDLQEPSLRITAKNGAEQDDLLVACMMAAYWRRVLWHSTKPLYRQFCQNVFRVFGHNK